MLTIAVWSATSTFIILIILKYTVGMRMSPTEELLGADWMEHGVHSEGVAERIERALEALEQHRGSLKPNGQKADEMQRLLLELRRPTIQLSNHIRTVVGTRMSSPRNGEAMTEPFENLALPFVVTTDLTSVTARENENEKEQADSLNHVEA